MDGHHVIGHMILDWWDSHVKHDWTQEGLRARRDISLLVGFLDQHVAMDAAVLEMLTHKLVEERKQQSEERR